MNEQEQSDNFKVMNLTDLPDRYFVVNEQKPVNPSVANLFDFDIEILPSFERHRRSSRRLSSRRASDAFFSHPFCVLDYTSFEEANNETEEVNDDDEYDSTLSAALQTRKQTRINVNSKKRRSIAYKKSDSIKISSEINSGTNNASFIESRSSKNSPPILNKPEVRMPHKKHNIENFNKSVAESINDDIREHRTDIWTSILVGISYVILIMFFPFSLCSCIKICQEYERAVIFRLGRILQMGAKGPGLFFVLPCIDTYLKVDLRTVTFDVPPQEILTKDSVTVSVDAVVYFRILNAVVSVINVEDAAKSTKLLAATTLRNILGTKSLQEILSDRESVAFLIQSNLDDATEPWGVKVERVEVKDVRLPIQLQRAMATEAEATREARAKVIAAEGEQKASKALKEAAEVISESPIAIQLRYLQTLTAIASERNSTIVFPVPIEILGLLTNKTIEQTI